MQREVSWQTGLSRAAAGGNREGAGHRRSAAMRKLSAQRRCLDAKPRYRSGKRRRSAPCSGFRGLPRAASESQKRERRQYRAREVALPSVEPALAPAEGVSCNAIDAQRFVIDSRRSETQGLLEILRLQKRVVRKQRSPIGIGRQQFQYASYGDPQASNAGPLFH